MRYFVLCFLPFTNSSDTLSYRMIGKEKKTGGIMRYIITILLVIMSSILVALYVPYGTLITLSVFSIFIIIVVFFLFFGMNYPEGSRMPKSKHWIQMLQLSHKMFLWAFGIVLLGAILIHLLGDKFGIYVLVFGVLSMLIIHFFSNYYSKLISSNS
jgi:hypothetical protein